MNSDTMGAIWTIASVLSGALLFVGGIMWQAERRNSAWAWFMLSCAPMIFSTIVWAPMANGSIWRMSIAGLVGAIGGAVILIGVTQMLHSNANAQTNPPDDKPPSGPSSPSDPKPTVGESITGNNQGGAAKEIISNGQPGSPSIGEDLRVFGAPGQNVTGLQVIQNGPGTGLRIIQNGPGTGLRVTVGAPPAH